MSEASHEWPVPVVTFADKRPQNLTVTVVDGDVVTQGPKVPYVLSRMGYELLGEAYRAAFQAAQDMDQGLS
jgi:hypothetical protein